MKFTKQFEYRTSLVGRDLRIFLLSTLIKTNFEILDTIELNSENGCCKDKDKRAALGLSEQTDAIIIIVSEETGSISYAINSQLHYKISLNKLKSTLVKNFISFV